MRNRVLFELSIFSQQGIGRMYSYLFETNIVSVLPEALSADIQAVFADKSMLVGAGPAERKIKIITRVLTK